MRNSLFEAPALLIELRAPGHDPQALGVPAQVLDIKHKYYVYLHIPT